MKAVTAAQMRRLEQAAVEAGVSLDELMENAGRVVGDEVAAKLGNAAGSRVVVLVGPGNNGGDGLVAATRLAQLGAAVEAFVVAGNGDPAGKRPAAEAAGVRVGTAMDESGIRTMSRAAASADVVIDAVLGTGASRPIGDPLGRALAAVLQNGTPVVAVDLPTGMNADTGQFDPNGIRADLTLMLANPKIGPVINAGSGHCGEIKVLDIGIPPGLDSGLEVEWLDSQLTSSLLPPRPADSHKGTFGRALLVAGSPQYPGAALLATSAATRSGAGLVELTTESSVYDLVVGAVPEAIYTPLAESNSRELDSSESARQVIDRAAAATSVLIGPGFGTSVNKSIFARTLAKQAGSLPPLVIDADALNILAGTYRWWESLPESTIVTPHPGEMARLLRRSTTEVQADRLGAARSAAEQWGVNVVLKGAATLIVSPAGRVRISPFVNAGLAKGGTGDVLAGLASGLLAQMPDRPFDAAALAVYVHGLAGEIARSSKGEIGMRAGDVIDAIPDAFIELASCGRKTFEFTGTPRTGTYNSDP